MGLVVKKPGVSTTIQDLGRIGYLGSGFSPNGVMDRRAAILANILVENDFNANVLEFPLAGPTLRFTTDTFIALTGADFSPRLNDHPVPLYKTLFVKHGSVLSMSSAKSGMFGYLAISDGSIGVSDVMGSASTNLKCGIGGWHGRALLYGDYLPFRAKEPEFITNLESHKIECDHIYDAEEDGAVLLRVVPGPQDDLFTQNGIDTFYHQEYQTTTKSDRMGYRLDGPAIETKHGSDIISDGIAFGAVQVPSHGRPIIMLADRQTTGGYAKIGTIASVDIPKIVQCPPGQRIRFTPITVQEAQKLYRQQAAFYHALAKTVNRPCTGGVSPRRAARRITPILEAQARKPKTEAVWLKASKKEQ